MANRFWLCLFLFYLVLNYSDCGRFSSGGSRSSSRGGSRSSSSGSSRSSSSGGSRSSSSGSRGWGSSSSSSSYKHSYPSSSGYSGSRQTSHSYSSSSSGLSGSRSNTNYWNPWKNTNTASGTSSSYPLSTGLSGSGSSSGSKYPASTGLSGSKVQPWQTMLSYVNSKGEFKYPGSLTSILLNSGSGSKYPSSTRLSGTSSGTLISGSGSGSKYPASTGLSGSGSASIYPASTGLSGSGSGSKYPAPTGLTGSGSASKYPASTGLSGTGSGYSWSTGSSGPLSGSKYSPPGSSNIGSGKHSYPTLSTGLSGSVIRDPSIPHHTVSNNANSKPIPPYHPSSSYNTNSAFGSGFNGDKYYGYGHSNFYTAPQHIYVTEYRNSNSRFGDLLTGLTLYNLGRSHSHYHDHYYSDDYYRRRYNTGSYQTSHEKPKDEAYCTLGVKESGKFEELKIPCEIVSTFTEGSKKSSVAETETVCVSNYTVINNTQPTTLTTPSNVTAFSKLQNNETLLNLNVIPINASTAPLPNITISLSNSTSNSSRLPDTAILNVNVSTTIKPILESINNTASIANQSVTTTNISIMNATKCTTTTDPLSVKGPPVNPANMDCEVNIITKESRYSTKIDCQKLIQYSKMPDPPKKESPVAPEKSKLKSWLSNPPWWMSMFIAL